MDYKTGDVVSLSAVKVKSSDLAGRLHVKIIKNKDGLYFKPFIFKYVSSIPISAIDCFDPIWIMEGGNKNHLLVEDIIQKQGLEYYEVMWTVISNVWESTKIAVKF